MELFEEICNSKWFSNTSIILFLNKKDLFEEKLMRVPLRDDECNEGEGRFTDYEGGDSVPAATAYLEGKFKALNRDPTKEVFVKTTCATDTTNVRTIFDACKEIILGASLAEVGL